VIAPPRRRGAGQTEGTGGGGGGGGGGGPVALRFCGGTAGAHVRGA